jgi:hypothetical protein
LKTIIFTFTLHQAARSAVNFYSAGIATRDRRIGSCQGDQIGRIFAYWAINYFVKLYKNYKRKPNL